MCSCSVSLSCGGFAIEYERRLPSGSSTCRYWPALNFARSPGRQTQLQHADVDGGARVAEHLDAKVLRADGSMRCHAVRHDLQVASRPALAEELLAGRRGLARRARHLAGARCRRRSCRTRPCGTSTASRCRPCSAASRTFWPSSQAKRTSVPAMRIGAIGGHPALIRQEMPARRQAQAAQQRVGPGGAACRRCPSRCRGRCWPAARRRRSRARWPPCGASNFTGMWPWSWNIATYRSCWRSASSTSAPCGSVDRDVRARATSRRRARRARRLPGRTARLRRRAD